MTSIVINGEEVSRIEIGGGVYFEKSTPSELYIEYTLATNPTLVREDFNSTAEMKSRIAVLPYLKTLKAVRSKDFDIFTDMSYMFANNSHLTSLDLSSFDTSQATNIGWMFRNNEALISLDLSSFDASLVTNITGMFSGCNSLISIDLPIFSTSSLTKMGWLFNECQSLISLDLSNFDTSQVTDMGWTFSYCESLTSLDLSSFDTSQVISIGDMFRYCTSVTTAWARTQTDADKFNSSADKPDNVNFIVKPPELYIEYTTVSSEEVQKNTFANSIDLQAYIAENKTSFKTMKVIKEEGFSGIFIDTSSMFSGCTFLTTLELDFEADYITNMSGMFHSCIALISIKLPDSWNAHKADNMSAMFYGCSSLTNINLEDFFASPTTTQYMFRGCSSLTVFDLSGLFMNYVLGDDDKGMFQECYAARTCYARTQTDADKLNTSSSKPTLMNFIVKTG